MQARYQLFMPDISLPKVLIGSEFVDASCVLLSRARESVDIVVYDWRVGIGHTSEPVKQFTNAVAGARLRGCKVRVLVNNDGVREYLSRLGLECKRLYSASLVHAKMLLIDRQIAVVGSHNYTQGAFTMNLEVSLAVDLGDTDNELAAYFDRIWPL